MADIKFPKLTSFKTAADLRAHFVELGEEIPCDDTILTAPGSPLAQPIEVNGLRCRNRWAIQPMEGWDAEKDGNPSELTFRRWEHFGQSGAALIWGGEAVAVRFDGRANPNQLYMAPHTHDGFKRLRDRLVQAHVERFGSEDGLVLGLQLTHSGRFCKPNDHFTWEPKIAYHHPLLDRKFNIPEDLPILTDGELHALVDDYVTAAKVARDAGFQFVDIKHCHGYLAHELLSAFNRPGHYGGSFHDRTRFCREIIQGIRAEAPDLAVGVRFSATDVPPFVPDPDLTTEKELGPGVPMTFRDLLPYRYAFGVDEHDPLTPNLSEPVKFLRMLRDLGVRLINVSAGSPYYTPHLIRPAAFPPSDGYKPPEDPLVGVARHLKVTRDLKKSVRDMTYVGSGYSYLQDYLPHVGQAAVREGGTDFVGMGRMVLTYWEMPADSLEKGEIERKRICRTFSDCTTAPRHGMVSGCYPLDPYYKDKPEADKVKAIKTGK